MAPDRRVGSGGSRPYEGASGVKYHPMFAVPVLVFSADEPAICRAFDRAGARDLVTAVYTRDLFATGKDVDNRAALAAASTDDLDLVGFTVAGDCRTVDKALAMSLTYLAEKWSCHDLFSAKE